MDCPILVNYLLYYSFYINEDKFASKFMSYLTKTKLNLSSGQANCARPSRNSLSFWFYFINEDLTKTSSSGDRVNKVLTSINNMTVNVIIKSLADLIA